MQPVMVEGRLIVGEVQARGLLMDQILDMILRGFGLSQTDPVAQAAQEVPDKEQDGQDGHDPEDAVETFVTGGQDPGQFIDQLFGQIDLSNWQKSLSEEQPPPREGSNADRPATPNPRPGASVAAEVSWFRYFREISAADWSHFRPAPPVKPPCEPAHLTP